MIATSQPLAVQAGLDVLRRGGNAVDATIAAAAVLGVVEPMSTGVGGDAFALVWHAETQTLHALNASGYAPKKATIEAYRERGFTALPQDGILSVTVPGAPRGWEALLQRFGSYKLGELLQPAIEYAERGFPVMEVAADRWQRYESRLKLDPDAASTYLLNGRAPRPGEIFKNPKLASTLKVLAREGVEAFYEGQIAEQLVKASEARGGLLTRGDLRDYRPQWVEPLSVEYRDLTVYEQPPNAQGLVALLALSILADFDLAAMGPGSPEYLHRVIEALKLAFADGRKLIADPRFADVPIEQLLSPDYAAERRALITEQVLEISSLGAPEGGTVYVTVVDEQRNVVSYIESIYLPFGSGVVAGETGILLQNRGALFTLDSQHPNCLEPHKRPYHTIIPAMAFRAEKPYLSFGVVGGFMQPQGHVQLLCNLIDFGMDLQGAIEAPRVRYLDGRRVALEGGIPDAAREELRRRGHEIITGAQNFGGAQAILIDPETGALAGGSDPRKDGCAQGF
jgi:gamma-glutamyltranspeptidase/glutathione hydrolase